MEFDSVELWMQLEKHLYRQLTLPNDGRKYIYRTSQGQTERGITPNLMFNEI